VFESIHRGRPPEGHGLATPSDDLTAVLLRFAASAVTLAVAVFLTFVR
jgi:hypothetical protein